MSSTELTDPSGGSIAGNVMALVEKRRRLAAEMKEADDVLAAAVAQSAPPTPAAEPIKPGNQTSEGKRAFAQQIVGYILVVAGGVLGTWGAEKGNGMLTTIGGIIASAGASMSGHAVKVHAENRTAQKIGAQP